MVVSVLEAAVGSGQVGRRAEDDLIDLHAVLANLNPDGMRRIGGKPHFAGVGEPHAPLCHPQPEMPQPKQFSRLTSRPPEDPMR